MPHDCLKRLRVRRDICGVDGRNHNRHIRDLRGITSISTDNSEKGAAAFLRQLQRRHQIRTHIFFQAASTHRQNKERVFFTEATSFKPFGENGSLSLIVGAGG